MFDDNAFLSWNVGDLNKVARRTGPLHTFASLSAACCPDIEEVYTDTWARLLACGREERELERLGSATRCEGTAPFWMGLDASGIGVVGMYGLEGKKIGVDERR